MVDRVTVALALPFAERWLVQNSPARRVPSHGTDLIGERYAIDFVGVDDRGNSAHLRDWRTAFATEPAERFFGFGRAILAPVDGVVAAAHDGEPDHGARRSQLALVPYMFGQAARLRQGVDAVAGNRLIIADDASGSFVALVHLKLGSLRVDVGDRVTAGQQIAECGNSGNSTQPHVHVQVMNSLDLTVARGIPLEFLYFRERSRGRSGYLDRKSGIPGEGSVVESL
jgi:hypothetical protein